MKNTRRLARALFKPEVIGEPECPILLRWTLGGDRLTRNWPVKVMLHYFTPKADDRHVHDHPRPFLTLVLRGGYDDLTLCWCMAPGAVRGGGPWLNHPECGGTGFVAERLRAGSVRYRSSGHTHRTRVGPRGCWTLVVMGPKNREWGFRKDGVWIPWRVYHERFGGAFRCDGDR